MIAVMSRAIGLLNSEDDFAAVEKVGDGIAPNPLGSLPASTPLPTSRPVGGSGSDIREFSQNLLMSAAQQTGFGERFVNVTGGIVQSVVELGGGGRKHSKGKLDTSAIAASQRGRIPSGLVQVQSLPAPSSATTVAGAGYPLNSGVSSSTQDGGVGMPSFAIQQALLMIKISAEICLQQFLNFSGSIPAYGEIPGISLMGSLWDEKLAVAQLLAERGTGPVNADALRRHVKIFAVDNRTLVSVVDEPALEEDPRKGASATIILRDAKSKNSWSMFLNYGSSGARYAPADETDAADDSVSEVEDVHASTDSVYRETAEAAEDVWEPDQVAAPVSQMAPLALAAINGSAIPSLSELVRIGSAQAGQVATTLATITSTSESPSVTSSSEALASRNTTSHAATPVKGEEAAM